MLPRRTDPWPRPGRSGTGRTGYGRPARVLRAAVQTQRGVPVGHVRPPRREGLCVRTDDLEALLVAHGAHCYGLARCLLGDPDTAGEAVRVAFLEHWRLRSGDASPVDARSGLLLLTRQSAVDLVRADPRRARPPRGTGPEPWRAAEVPERGGHVDLPAWRARAALAALPDADRQALSLAYWGGHTQGEVAAVTGVPLARARRRICSGVTSLRRALPGPAPG